MNDKIIFSDASDRVHNWVSFFTAMNIYVVVPGLCHRVLWQLVSIPVEPATSDFMIDWTGSFLRRYSNHLHQHMALQAKRPYPTYRKFAAVFYLHDK